jgi:hypothetical protein
VKEKRRKGRESEEILKDPTPAQRPLLDKFFRTWRNDKDPSLTAAEVDELDADSIDVGEALMAKLRLIEAGEHNTKNRHAKEKPARAARWAEIEAIIRATAKAAGNDADQIVLQGQILQQLKIKYGQSQFYWEGPEGQPDVELNPLTDEPLRKRVKLVLDQIKEQKKKIRAAP